MPVSFGRVRKLLATMRCRYGYKGQEATAEPVQVANGLSKGGWPIVQNPVEQKEMPQPMWLMTKPRSGQHSAADQVAEAVPGVRR